MCRDNRATPVHRAFEGMEYPTAKLQAVAPGHTLPWANPSPKRAPNQLSSRCEGFVLISIIVVSVQ